MKMEKKRKKVIKMMKYFCRRRLTCLSISNRSAGRNQETRSLLQKQRQQPKKCYIRQQKLAIQFHLVNSDSGGGGGRVSVLADCPT